MMLRATSSVLAFLTVLPTGFATDPKGNVRNRRVLPDTPTPQDVKVEEDKDFWERLLAGHGGSMPDHGGGDVGSSDPVNDKCMQGDYKLPRISIEFRRFPDWDGPTSPLPDYTENWEELNCHLAPIKALVKPAPMRTMVGDEEVLERILNYEAGIQEMINQFYIDDNEEFLEAVTYEAGRTPLFTDEQMNLNTTLVALDGSVIAPFPLVFPYGDLDNETLTALCDEFAPLHMNFWQGLDTDTGHVDPTRDPLAVEDRFIFLPPYNDDNVPFYMFFYLGEGVVCKIRLWVGTDVGWELNYLGMWPHAAVTFNSFHVFGQIAGGDPNWIAWYNLDDPSAHETVDFYMDQNQMDVDPDYDFVLGRNPWVNFDMIGPDTLEEIVKGE